MFNQYLKLEKFPLFYGPLSEEILSILPKTITLTVGVDTKYDLVRLKLDEELLLLLDTTYRYGSNPSVPLGVGKIQSKIMYSILNELEKFTNNDVPLNAVEIGCGEGYLLNELNKLNWNVKGYEISPIAKKASDSFHINVIQDYFRYEEGITYDLIFSYNVLEHIIDLEDFIVDGYKSLKENGVFCHIVPNCELMLKQGNLRVLSHQHVNYFTPKSLINLFQSFNFQNIQYKILYPGNALMVFGYKKTSTSFFENNLQKNDSSDLLSIFSNKLSDSLNKLNLFLDDAILKNKKIAFYSGGMSEYLLLNRKEKIMFVNGDPLMHNKRIFYELDEIKSPYELLTYKPDIILIFATNYFDEIKKYIQEELQLKEYPSIISIDEVIA